MDKSFDDRLSESKRLLEKFPTKIPIILKKNNTTDPCIKKYKYLVSNDLQLSALLFNIRKNCDLNPTQTLFFFVNGIIYNTSTYLKEIYDKEKEKDNFLYITYTAENTFGDFFH